MKVLITGANGQLGRSLQDVLASDPGFEITATDIDSLDLTDAEAVERCFADGKFDFAVNCAAYTAVDRAESDQLLCAAINREAVANLASAAKRHKVKIIHISTDYVFNGESFRPYDENDVPDPQSVYGRTKLEGEGVLMSYSPQSVVIRTAWLYSEYGSNFVKTMLRLGKEKPELSVVADQIGTPTYAPDLARAIHSILSAENWIPGIYHFTDEGVASWYDFTKAIHRIAGIKDCNVRSIATKDYPTAARRPAYSVLDKSKIKRTYNIDIPHWEESLTRCVGNLLEANTEA